jgi:hypothetical protein
MSQVSPLTLYLPWQYIITFLVKLKRILIAIQNFILRSGCGVLSRVLVFQPLTSSAASPTSVSLQHVFISSAAFARGPLLQDYHDPVSINQQLAGPKRVVAGLSCRGDLRPDGFMEPRSRVCLDGASQSVPRTDVSNAKDR